MQVKNVVLNTILKQQWNFLQFRVKYLLQSVMSYKLSCDKDFIGHQLCQLPDGVISNQTNFSYWLIRTKFIRVGLASHLNNFLPQRSLWG
jgi:hypothetical protein